MRISVLIPTYNSAATIQLTLDSVLRQSVLPHEILVLDDGSTDNTVSLLNSYKTRVTVFQEKHIGAASARNTLCEQASGDLIAFLDSDDIWHPSYLDMQLKLLNDHPNAAAIRIGHVNFYGYGNYEWNNTPVTSNLYVDVITPLNFFKRYNEAPGPFQTMSGWCVPMRTLKEIGGEPFNTALSCAIDSYFINVIATLGPVIYSSVPLVAYRIIKNSLSSDYLKIFGSNVRVFELLKDKFEILADVRFRRIFRMAFASKRRLYAKTLMGAGRTSDARSQICFSLRNTNNLISIAKSLTLLSLTYLPSKLQPAWPSSYREWEKS